MTTSTELREKIEEIVTEYGDAVDPQGMAQGYDEAIERLEALLSSQKEEYKSMIEGLRKKRLHDVLSPTWRAGYNSAILKQNKAIDEVLKRI